MAALALIFAVSLNGTCAGNIIRQLQESVKESCSDIIFLTMAFYHDVPLLCIQDS